MTGPIMGTLQARNNKDTPGPSKLPPTRSAPEPILEERNKAEMRELIQVELNWQNEERFVGAIPMLEANHGIYRDCLGFKDLSYFDGVSIAFKLRLCIKFKLKQPINIENLYEKRYFEFKKIQTTLKDHHYLLWRPYNEICLHSNIREKSHLN